ncbi:MAG: GtrA family protein [Clostridia bacterium]|nr:GtrA family protein [Clostridia bacterium]MBP5460011.1 GtrA family protein [Clostridia bacterium]
MERLKDLYLKYKEIINYLIFGGLTTVVSWGTYSIFIKGFGMEVAVGNVLSWICAVLFAFVTNKLFVFESKSWAPVTAVREFFSFIGARLFTGAIEWVGVPYFSTHGLTHPLFGVKGLLAKIVVSIVVIIMNYVFSKFLIFIKKKQ